MTTQLDDSHPAKGLATPKIRGGMAVRSWFPQGSRGHIPDAPILGGYVVLGNLRVAVAQNFDGSPMIEVQSTNGRAIAVHPRSGNTVWIGEQP